MDPITYGQVENVEMDGDQQAEEAREYFQIFNSNFQEEMISLSNMYAESVANYFRCFTMNINRNDSSPTSSNSTAELMQELNKTKCHLEEAQALAALLQSTQRVSQAIIKKFLEICESK